MALNGTSTLSQAFKSVRVMFYLCLPSESSFKTPEEVPDYVTEAVPYFIGLIILENIVLLLQGKKTFRSNDGLNSVTCGIYDRLPRLLWRSLNFTSYMWFYDRFCIIQLDWNSPVTWILCLLGMDFCFYWAHRGGHEINILWAGHQTHHSSEDYNLTTALRQGIFQNFFTWVLYLPLALFMPPSVYLVHSQFNLLFQFWIHTETIKSIGPLEWILNTPSHHRVHHGRNPYCIDKNYGGVLIIFDRLFGTFQSENEKVIYGLVHPLKSWNPVHAQSCHLVHIWKTFWKVEGIENKLSVLFKGPGWSPGKPRLGLKEDIPEVKLPVEKYNRDLPLWGKWYILLHFFWLDWFFVHVAEVAEILSMTYKGYMVLFIFCSFYGFGALYDHKHYAAAFEFIRCSVFLLTQNISPLTGSYIYLYAVNVVYFLSSCLWLLICIKTYTNFQFKVKTS